MLRRCENPKYRKFANYGGRGISVCSRWKDFENFASDMGLPPDSTMTINRIDNDGNYEPGNCHWATREEQCSNKRTSNIITFNGQSKTVTQWAFDTGQSVSGLKWRIQNGWDLAVALNQN